MQVHFKKKRKTRVEWEKPISNDEKKRENKQKQKRCQLMLTH